MWFSRVRIVSPSFAKWSRWRVRVVFSSYAKWAEIAWWIMARITWCHVFVENPPKAVFLRILWPFAGVLVTRCQPRQYTARLTPVRNSADYRIRIITDPLSARWEICEIFELSPSQRTILASSRVRVAAYYEFSNRPDYSFKSKFVRYLVIKKVMSSIN